MATEVGAGYVSIVPSTRGFAAALEGQIAAPVAAVAATTGTQAGTSLESGLLGALKGTSTKLLATLGFAGLGVAFLKSAESVEAANNIIIRSTGASGEKADELEASFKRLASSSPASFDTIATALSEVSQRTGLTGTALEGLTRQIITFNRISKDAPLNVQTLTQVLAGFNIPAAQMGTELDRLFTISQKTGVPLAQLIDTLTTAGPIARQFGFDLDFTAGFLAQLNKAGVDANSIMPGLRRAFVQFAKDGREPAAALRETLTQMDALLAAGDRVGAQNLAVQLFGPRGIGLVDAAVAGKISLQSLSEQINTTGKGILGTASSTQTLGAKLGILKNQATLAFGSFAAPALEQTTGLLADLVPIVGAIGTGFAKLSPVLVPTLEVLIAYKVATLAAAAATAILDAAVGAVTINYAGMAATAETAAAANAAVGVSFSSAAGPAAATFAATFIGTTALLDRYADGARRAIFGTHDFTKELGPFIAAEAQARQQIDGTVPSFNRAVEANARWASATGQLTLAQARSGSIMVEFKRLTEDNLGAAIRLAENYKQFPGTYAAMQAAIEATSGKRKQEQADLQASTEATQTLDQAMQDLQSTLLAAAGGEVGLTQANVNVTKAEQDLATAIRDHGENSDEARDASIRLQEAHVQQANAAISLDEEVQKLTETYGGNNAAIDAEIAKLEATKAKHGETAASIDPLIAQLQALRTNVDNVPTQHNIDIHVNLILNADRQTLNLVTGLSDLFDENGNIRGLASGGFAPSGWSGFVGEAGPEFMTVGPDGATVISAGQSRRIDKMSTSTADGGGEHFHFHMQGVPTDPERMARDTSRAWRTEMHLANR